jgi:hypothetical protein
MRHLDPSRLDDEAVEETGPGERAGNDPDAQSTHAHVAHEARLPVSRGAWHGSARLTAMSGQARAPPDEITRISGLLYGPTPGT